MARTLIRLAFVFVVGGICGLLAGSVTGVLCTGGPCSTLDPAFMWGGATLGAAVAAFAVVAEKPDPRACNRQDPPEPPVDSTAG